jgi:hypothetical protein
MRGDFWSDFHITQTCCKKAYVWLLLVWLIGLFTIVCIKTIFGGKHVKRLKGGWLFHETESIFRSREQKTYISRNGCCVDNHGQNKELRFTQSHITYANWHHATMAHPNFVASSLLLILFYKSHGIYYFHLKLVSVAKKNEKYFLFCYEDVTKHNILWFVHLTHVLRECRAQDTRELYTGFAQGKFTY